MDPGSIPGGDMLGYKLILKMSSILVLIVNIALYFLVDLSLSSRGLVVRTPPSHGGNRGFEPLRERFLYC